MYKSFIAKYGNELIIIDIEYEHRMTKQYASLGIYITEKLGHTIENTYLLMEMTGADILSSKEHIKYKIQCCTNGIGIERIFDDYISAEVYMHKVIEDYSLEEFPLYDFKSRDETLDFIEHIFEEYPI